VHSTVLRLTMAPRFDELHVAPEPFIAFLRASFAQKRKMLAKNLRNAGHTPEAIAAALAACNISPQSRAEELDLAIMACLYRRLSQSDR
jgi:16S rRNA (adenine1518-N6/adenine1519-N6)-dimethyltransferase